MRKITDKILILIILLSICVLAFQYNQTDEANSHVRAVLFYSPSCPHCHKVITEDLPPLYDEYPTQLEILYVDISGASGYELYQTTIDFFEIPPDRRGVPTLIIGDIVLVGSLEIPQQLPGLVEQYLSMGGVDWPAIPGLTEILMIALASPTATQSETHAAPGTPPADFLATPSVTKAYEGIETPHGPIDFEDNSSFTLCEKLARDPLGNGAAITLLIAMIVVVSWVIVNFFKIKEKPIPGWTNFAIPLLAIIGLSIAAYLAYVEINNVTAVCGPVGDCNTVQQSEYARLYGIIPIGVLGIVGYLLILVFWSIQLISGNPFENWGSLFIFLISLFGSIFSIYLTFLEPFVIGATCAWCLGSAVIMTGLLCLSTSRGKAAFNDLIIQRR